MRIRLTYVTAILFIAIIIQSCSSPQSIVKLQPKDEGGRWLYGQNFVSDSLYGVILEVGFDQFSENQYWFDFNIVNRSNMPILIDPVNFTCQTYNFEQQAISTVKIHAIDPEDKIVDLERNQSINIARQKSSVGISLVAAAIDITSAAIVATDENPNNDYLRTHVLDDVLIDNEEAKFEAQSINDLLYTWKSSTIRKTTLESNYSMQGKVFFPGNRDASYVKLFLPVDNDFIEFNFNQRLLPVQ